MADGDYKTPEDAVLAPLTDEYRFEYFPITVQRECNTLYLESIRKHW